MALDRTAFDALVARYEALEESAPRLGRTRAPALTPANPPLRPQGRAGTGAIQAPHETRPRRFAEAVPTRWLQSDQPEIASYVDNATALDGKANAIAQHHQRKNKREQAYQHADTSDERKLIGQLAQAERNVVRIEDKLDPHALDETTIAKLRDELKALGVQKAHLFRKRCKHLPEKPLWILGFRERRPFRFHDNDRARVMQKRIIEGGVTFPGPTIVL